MKRITRPLLAVSVAAAALVLVGCEPRRSDWDSGHSSPARHYGYGAGTEQSQPDETAEEALQAKDAFQEAASELKSAVQALSFTPWRDQMHTIRARLDDAEEALDTLEGLRGSDPSVQSARDELDNMRQHMDRLYFENWRDVRPDLDSTSTYIEDEALSISDLEDSED